MQVNWIFVKQIQYIQTLGEFIIPSRYWWQRNESLNILNIYNIQFDFKYLMWILCHKYEPISLIFTECAE